MINILYDDNHILAMVKPAGLLTQPSGTEQESLEAEAKAWLKKRYQKPGNVFLHAVHRLDKPVSGIVLFAKTSKALTRLNETLRGKEWHKLYTALVEGKLPEREGLLEHRLMHGELGEEGQVCRLRYNTIGKDGPFTRLEIELETGRYHQIRAQLAAIGCPVVGDFKYGSHAHLKDRDAIALHHHHLEFPHPVQDERVILDAPAAFQC